MKTLKKILHIKLTILTIILLPLAVLAMLSSKTEIAGFRTFVVLTGSMSPTIPAGSLIVTKRDTAYNTGDVIAFTQGNVTITHRIVKITNGNFVTKGDANNVEDSKAIAPSSILGITLFHLPYIGSAILFLRTFQGFLSLVIVPGVLFIAFEFWNIKKEMEKEIEKKMRKKLDIKEASIA